MRHHEAARLELARRHECEPLHVTRSGRFVPSVFGRIFTDMIVSPEVREALSRLPHGRFNAVVFEHLVDLPMPELGDFSWHKRKDLEKYDIDPDNLLRSLPHVPELEKAVEGYRQLLPANLDDVADQYDDVELVPLDFESYNYEHYLKEMPVSQRILKEYPIIQSPHLLFREDAFALIAPFLDLDYYAISVLNFDD